MKTVEIIVSILSGLAVCIPLAARLAQCAARAVREKNWRGVLSLALGLMQQAEELFDSGAARREWVVEMTLAAARETGCEMDEKTLGELVDSLCEMAKHVNAGGRAA